MENTKVVSEAQEKLGGTGDSGQGKAEPGDVKAAELSETWAHDTIQEMDDWIEAQGIYLRQ